MLRRALSPVAFPDCPLLDLCGGVQLRCSRLSCLVLQLAWDLHGSRVSWLVLVNKP
ncbi:hypothetical protein PISMIDRAFT_350128 [Pisolithus microcarpus 441]|uniref:Uncharacterized protein n=1 Tax=Pisolithus microcarpus 441 TaxID=765257 RepID=A0A0C9YWL1_9AGAM|nr:hypothetical protein PISMIDRAFT_350128 [Pisolithus microcarpus 441]